MASLCKIDRVLPLPFNKLSYVESQLKISLSKIEASADFFLNCVEISPMTKKTYADIRAFTPDR